MDEAFPLLRMNCEVHAVWSRWMLLAILTPQTMRTEFPRDMDIKQSWTVCVFVIRLTKSAWISTQALSFSSLIWSAFETVAIIWRHINNEQHSADNIFSFLTCISNAWCTKVTLYNLFTIVTWFLPLRCHCERKVTGLLLKSIISCYESYGLHSLSQDNTKNGQCFLIFDQVHCEICNVLGNI